METYSRSSHLAREINGKMVWYTLCGRPYGDSKSDWNQSSQVGQNWIDDRSSHNQYVIRWMAQEERHWEAGDSLRDTPRPNPCVVLWHIYNMTFAVTSHGPSMLIIQAQTQYILTPPTHTHTPAAPEPLVDLDAAPPVTLPSEPPDRDVLVNPATPTLVTACTESMLTTREGCSHSR